MKKPIKIIAAIVAFVFATEQIVYPAPYSGQWSGGSFTLRPAASRAAIPAGDPQAFFGEPLVATTTLLLEEERTLNAMLAQESLPPAIRTEIERLRDRLYAAKLDPTAADKPAQKAIAISDRQDGLAIASGTEEPVAQDKPADPASADATSESWQAIITTVREFLRKRRVSRAIEQLIEGKTEEALVAFGRAIRVDPQHADRIAEDIISKTRDEKQPLEGITGPLIEVLKNKATPTHERVISAWLLGEIGCIGPDKARKDVRTPLKRRRYGETLSKYPNYLLLWAIAGSLNKMKAEVKPPEKARWNPSQRQEEILQILKDIFDKGNKELKDKLKSERYKVEIIAAPGDSALASGRYFDGIEPLHIYVCCPSMSDSEVKELNKAKGRWQAAIEEIRQALIKTGVFKITWTNKRSIKGARNILFYQQGELWPVRDPSQKYMFPESIKTLFKLWKRIGSEARIKQIEAMERLHGAAALSRLFGFPAVLYFATTKERNDFLTALRGADKRLLSISDDESNVTCHWMDDFEVRLDSFEKTPKKPEPTRKTRSRSALLAVVIGAVVGLLSIIFLPHDSLPFVPFVWGGIRRIDGIGIDPTAQIMPSGVGPSIINSLLSARNDAQRESIIRSLDPTIASAIGAHLCSELTQGVRGQQISDAERENIEAILRAIDKITKVTRVEEPPPRGRTHPTTDSKDTYDRTARIKEGDPLGRLFDRHGRTTRTIMIITAIGSILAVMAAIAFRFFPEIPAIIQDFFNRGGDLFIVMAGTQIPVGPTGEKGDISTEISAQRIFRGITIRREVYERELKEALKIAEGGKGKMKTLKEMLSMAPDIEYKLAAAMATTIFGNEGRIMLVGVINRNEDLLTKKAAAIALGTIDNGIRNLAGMLSWSTDEEMLEIGAIGLANAPQKRGLGKGGLGILAGVLATNNNPKAKLKAAMALSFMGSDGRRRLEGALLNAKDLTVKDIAASALVTTPEGRAILEKAYEPGDATLRRIVKTVYEREAQGKREESGARVEGERTAEPIIDKTPEEKAADRHFKEGKRLFVKKQFEEAMKEFIKAYNLGKDEARIWIIKYRGLLTRDAEEEIGAIQDKALGDNITFSEADKALNEIITALRKSSVFSIFRDTEGENIIKNLEGRKDEILDLFPEPDRHGLTTRTIIVIAAIGSILAVIIGSLIAHFIPQIPESGTLPEGLSRTIRDLPFLLPFIGMTKSDLPYGDRAVIIRKRRNEYDQTRILLFASNWENYILKYHTKPVKGEKDRVPRYYFPEDMSRKEILDMVMSTARNGKPIASQQKCRIKGSKAYVWYLPPDLTNQTGIMQMRTEVKRSRILYASPRIGKDLVYIGGKPRPLESQFIWPDSAKNEMENIKISTTWSDFERMANNRIINRVEFSEDGLGKFATLFGENTSMELLDEIIWFAAKNGRCIKKAELVKPKNRWVFECDLPPHLIIETGVDLVRIVVKRGKKVNFVEDIIPIEGKGVAVICNGERLSGDKRSQKIRQWQAELDRGEYAPDGGGISLSPEQKGDDHSLKTIGGSTLVELLGIAAIGAIAVITLVPILSAYIQDLFNHFTSIGESGTLPEGLNRTIRDLPFLLLFAGMVKPGKSKSKRRRVPKARLEVERLKQIFDSAFSYGYIKEAIEFAQEGIARYPKEVDFYYSLCKAHYKEADYVSMENALRQMEKNFPDSPYYWVIKGIFLADARDEYPEAIQAYNKAIELGFTSWTCQNNIGVACFMMKDYGRAIECFEKVIRTKGIDLPDAHFAKATAYLARGIASGDENDISTGQDIFEELFKKIPINNRHTLTRTYAGIEKRKKIDIKFIKEALFNTAVKDDTSPEAKMNIIWLFGEVGANDTLVRIKNHWVDKTINEEILRTLDLALRKTERDDDEEIQKLKEDLRGRPDSRLMKVTLADKYAKKSRFDDAEPYYLEILDIDPNDSSGLFGMGNVSYGRGRLSEALDYIKESLRYTQLDPNKIWSYCLMGRIYVKREQFEDAIDNFRKAIILAEKIGSEDEQHIIESKLYWAFSLLELYKFKEASGKLEIFIKERKKRKRPEDKRNIAIALCYLSRCYYFRSYKDVNLIEKAFQAVQEAISFDPDFDDAYRRLGDLYMEKGQIDQAIEYIEKAKAINPDDADTHIALAMALREKGDFEKAREHLSEAGKLTPDVAALVELNLGIIHLYEGDITYAQERFTKAAELGLSPNRVSYYEMVACLQANDTSGAKEKAGQTFISKDFVTRQDTIYAHMCNKINPEEVIEFLFSLLIGMQIKDRKVKENLLWFLNEIAKDELQKKVKELLDEAKRIYRNKKYEEAMGYVNGALTLDPNNKETRRLRGMIKEVPQLIEQAREAIKFGKFKGAIKICNRGLINFDPENAELKEIKSLAERSIEAPGIIEKYLKEGQILYDEAVSLIGQNQVEQAKQKLREAINVWAKIVDMEIQIYKKTQEAKKKIKRARGLLRSIEKAENIEQMEEDIREGASLLESGRFIEAIAPLERALAIDPGNEKAKELLNRAKEKQAKEMAIRAAEEQARMQTERAIGEVGEVKERPRTIALEKALTQVDEKLAVLEQGIREGTVTEEVKSVFPEFVTRNILPIIKDAAVTGKLSINDGKAFFSGIITNRVRPIEKSLKLDREVKARLNTEVQKGKDEFFTLIAKNEIEQIASAVENMLNSELPVSVEAVGRHFEGIIEEEIARLGLSQDVVETLVGKIQERKTELFEFIDTFQPDSFLTNQHRPHDQRDFATDGGISPLLLVYRFLNGKFDEIFRDRENVDMEQILTAIRSLDLNQRADLKEGLSNYLFEKGIRTSGEAIGEEEFFEGILAYMANLEIATPAGVIDGRDSLILGTMSYSKVEGIMQSMKSERIERIWSGDNRNELVDEALRRAVNFAHLWSEEDKSTESINIYMVTDYWLMSLGGYVAGWVDYSDYNNIYVNKEIWDSLSKIARAWLLRYLLNVRRHALKEAPSHRQIEVPQDLAAELRDIYNEKLFDLRKVNTEKAFEQFIKVNEGLIRYCIRAFRNYIRFLVPEALQNNQYGYEITGYSEKDIRQDVLEQMWRSFQGFDKGKRFTFSTYFVGVWKIIRGRVLLNYFITHMPKSEIHTINYIRAFRNKENRPPTLEELKEKYPKRAKGYLETCLRTEENLRNGLYKHTFVDAPLATEEFEEALESVGAAPLTRDDTQTLESYMYIQEIFEQCKLTPEEKFVLSLRNGIPVDEDLLSSLVLYEVSVIEPRSYYQDEIAPLLHLTRGRIQQIEAKAIKKIKHPAHKGLFERFGVSSPGPVEANMVGPMFRGNLPWLRQVVQNIGSKISRLIRDEFGGMKMGKDGEAEPPEDQVPSLGILRLDKLKEHLSLLIAVGKEDKRSPDKIAEDIVNDAELINVLSTYRALVELAVESTDSGDEFTKATANAAIRRFNQNPSKNLEASKQKFIDQMEELLVMLEKDIKDWRSGFRRRRISVRLGEIESEMHDMITCLAELEESELVDTLLDMYVKRLEKPLMKNFYREHFPCYVMLRAACRSKYYGYKLEKCIALADWTMEILRSRERKGKRNDRPIIGELLMRKADCYRLMGNLSEALRNGQKAIRLFKDYLETPRGASDRGLKEYLLASLRIMSSIHAQLNIEKARQTIEEAIEFRKKEDMWDDEAEVADMYTAAADIYLRGISFFKDALSIAETYLSEAKKLTPEDHRLKALSAWVSFEKGDIDQAMDELSKIEGEITDDKVILIAMHLYKAIAFLFKRKGMQEEAKAVIDLVLEFIDAGENIIKESKRDPLDKGLGAEIAMGGFFAITESYDEASMRLKETLTRCQKEKMLVSIAAAYLAFINIARALEKGEEIGPFDKDREILDYVSNLLISFSKEHYSTYAVDMEYRWHPKEDKENFIRALLAILGSDSPKIKLVAKLNILKFLKTIKAWGIMNPSELIKQLNEIKTKLFGSRRKTVRRKKTAPERAIDSIIDEVIKMLSPNDRLERARASFEKARYEDVIQEAEAGLAKVDSEAEPNVASDLGQYHRAAALMIEADKDYKGHRFGTAAANYRIVNGMLIENLLREDLRIIDDPNVLARLEKAGRMQDAESQYLEENDDEAIRIAQDVGGRTSAAFVKKIGDLRSALGLIEGNPRRAAEAIQELTDRYPDDARIRAAEAKASEAVSEMLGKEEWVRLQLRNARASLDEDNLEHVLEILQAVLKEVGFDRNAIKLLIEAAEKAYQQNKFDLALSFAQEGLRWSPTKKALLRIKQNARAKIVAGNLTHHLDIIASQIEADNLKTEAKWEKFHHALDYTFARIDKDPDLGRIIFSDLSRFSDRDSREVKLREMPKVTAVINKGETYVIVPTVAGRDNSQFFLEAVEVNKDHAVFKISSEEDRELAFTIIPNQDVTIRKVQDPSLVNRRNLLKEAIKSIESSIGKGRIATTGYRLLDVVLGLEELPALTFKERDITFKNSNIEKDEAQSKAVQAALDLTIPLTLIQGPPGTGKTSVIVELVRQFAQMGKKVLVVSQSNPGVDNVGLRLLKLQEEGEKIKFARVGNNETSIAPGLRKHWYRKKEILREMRESRNGCIVLGTNNGFILDSFIRTDGYYRGDYDVVIVEEAGRATLAETLYPISKAKQDGKVILVGDHKQLPAYGIDQQQIKDVIDELLKYGRRSERWLKNVFNRKRIKEYRTSLFETLWEKTPALGEGYKHLLLINRRSHPVIAKLVSILFYGGIIKVDPDKDPTPEPDTITLIDYGKGERKFYDKKIGTSYRNFAEANIVLDELDRFLNQTTLEGYRYNPDDITVITPYQPQIALIRHALEIKAIINDIRSGKLSQEEALSEDKLKKLEDAIDKKPYNHDIDRVIAAIARLNDVYGNKGEVEELLRSITPALLFDIQKRHGQRSITWNELKELKLFEVETVDSIQGSENDAVILSLVRSNRSGSIGFLGTEDGIQRLTVAYSRAREKLTIIGDFANTLTKARYRLKPKKDEDEIEIEKEIEINTQRARGIFTKTVEYWVRLRLKEQIMKHIQAHPTKPFSIEELMNNSRELVDEFGLTETDFKEAIAQLHAEGRIHMFDKEVLAVQNEIARLARILEAGDSQPEEFTTQPTENTAEPLLLIEQAA